MKLTVTRSKHSELFYIQQSYINSEGKSTTRTIRKLGSLKELSKKLGTDRDGVYAWAEEQTRLETERYQQETEKISISLSPVIPIKKDQQRLYHSGYLFLQCILRDLRFHNMCRRIKTRHKYDYDLEAILSDLVYARVLEPSSKRSSYEFAKSLLEPPKYQLHHVYRALSVLASEADYIQAEVYKNSNFLHPRNKTILYYDCTNYYFEIEQEDGFRKYGRSKENRPNPIVGMGLFMDADGFPLAFDLHPGSQNEQTTLKPLEKKVIRDFDCGSFIYCSDSGLASKSNKLFNDMRGRSYVITQSLKKLKEEDRNIALDTKQYRKIGSRDFIDLATLDETSEEAYNSVYYKEIPIESEALSETLIVTYSPKYKAYQRKIRQGQILRAQKLAGSGKKPKKSRHNPNDPARFVKEISTTKDGEAADQTTCFLDQDAIAEEEQYDGFYAVVTDIEGDVRDIIAINKRRWQIEECFEIMKTDFEARPVYLSREDRIKAHFLTCFLALLVYRILENKLEKKYTTDEILSTIRSMNVVNLEDYGYVPAYTRTDLSTDLHNIFGFRTDMQIIRKSTMRSIIRQTKTKN